MQKEPKREAMDWEEGSKVSEGQRLLRKTATQQHVCYTLVRTSVLHEAHLQALRKEPSSLFGFTKTVEVNEASDTTRLPRRRHSCASQEAVGSDKVGFSDQHQSWKQ